MSLKYEPASEPLHISATLNLNSGWYQVCYRQGAGGAWARTGVGVVVQQGITRVSINHIEANEGVQVDLPSSVLLLLLLLFFFVFFGVALVAAVVGVVLLFFFFSFGSQPLAGVTGTSHTRCAGN